MRKRVRLLRKRGSPPKRRGAASLDYVLVLCVVLPMVAFMMTAGREIMWLTYEMLSTLITWPFM
ncbi:MAG TPA: hypothetical protein PK777_16390 [Thermoguttaceae bacterium]|jgi:hypothetical protein|nr:hypothetical protein [Thermoguttaceae bacterium]HPP54534.1 hypothetical protein [Thermoguttaceae bacterium]